MPPMPPGMSPLAAGAAFVGRQAVVGQEVLAQVLARMGQGLGEGV